jgi:hypothetical protein
VGKRIEDFSRRTAFFGPEASTLIAGLAGAIDRGDQVLIAAISGPTPMIAITRFML